MQEENHNEPLGTVNLADIPSPEQVIAENAARTAFARSVVSINAFPPYKSEEENYDILIKGRWLERGGSAWWVSTAGTGKSIATIQLAYKWGVGLDFAGLQPHRPIRTWIIQSEDSPSRITIDREDVVSELTEKYPDVDWHAVGEKMVKFVKLTGKVGVDFLAYLDELLDEADRLGQKPDVVIINPFMAFVGGPVSDGGYVTPFLRGGDINHQHTDGLQMLLEKHNVATLIFHHTPKPPTDKEVDAWLKSMFPEYQGAGSSDITNWGRSFITMMRVKGHPRVVCMVAGKNGSEIGWEEIGGSRRKYMAWSNEQSITGGGRHAWRELTSEEYDEIVGKEKSESSEAVTAAINEIVSSLKVTALNVRAMEDVFTGRFKRNVLRSALSAIKANPQAYHLSAHKELIGKHWTTFIGQAESIRAAVKLFRQKAVVEKVTKREIPVAEAVKDMPVAKPAQNEETHEEEIVLPF